MKGLITVAFVCCSAKLGHGRSSNFLSTLSSKLHSSIVLKSELLAKKSGATSAVVHVAPTLKRKDPPLVAPLPNPTKAPASNRLVKGTRMKKQVLSEYQERYGGNHPEPITTQPVKGAWSERIPQPPSQCDLVKSSRMKPDPEKFYNVDRLSVENVIVLALAEMLGARDSVALTCASKTFQTVVPEVARLLKVDWRPLLEPRFDYQLQDQIDKHRVDMATALAVRSGLDPGKIVRTLGGEYTAAWRDVDKVLDAVSSVVSESDYAHIRRILTQGCPHSLKFEESPENKARALARGNQKSFVMNEDIVAKTINKEDRNSHIVTLHGWVCGIAPNFRHTSQALVFKEGSDPRPVWDGTTKFDPNDVVINEVTLIENEAEITFGEVKASLLQISV